MLFLCMDTNFHLKNQIISNYSQDLGLGTGWAYMAPHEDYVLKLRNRVTISVAHWLVTIVFSSARTDMITSQQMNISFVMA
jgi:hypothetical protein